MGEPIVARVRDSPLSRTPCYRLVRQAEPPALGRGTYAGSVRVREPVARPLDIVAVELSLSASQAFLTGVLLYLAVGLWEDRGVGLGSVAAVVILLGLAVGAAWLYWLLGGVGWPMAAADLVAGLFLAAMLVLTWFGETFRVAGAPLLLAVVAAVFGVVAGVFLDSPRRWRWDQREHQRPGTRVPRVSPATQALVAQMPRALPRRAPAEEPVSDLAARIESAPPPVSTVAAAEATQAEVDEPSPAGTEEPKPGAELAEAPAVAGTPLEVPDAPEPVLPTQQRRSVADDGADEDGSIELPTMVEPKAQRSPWAWAAPPAWNRDEDDEPSPRSSGRS